MAVEVLEHNGFNVLVPPQDCCGLPLQSNGQFDAARRYVRSSGQCWRRTRARPARIVGTSTSCSLMLKREAREILDARGRPRPRGRRPSDVYDICEFLLCCTSAASWRTGLQPLALTVPYHAPCQQQGHGIGKPALDLMALIPELRVIENDADCCGVAGTYGIKNEKYEIAMNVGVPLFDQIEGARPTSRSATRETCRWHIEGSTGVRTVHPLEIIHRAAGLSSDAELRAPA